MVIAAFHALTWPQCLHRLEGVSPEVDRLWLSHVKEARPVYMHGWRIATLISALPIIGTIGWGLLAWWRWSERELRRRILGAALPGIAARAAAAVAGPHRSRRSDAGRRRRRGADLDGPARCVAREELARLVVGAVWRWSSAPVRSCRSWSLRSGDTDDRRATSRSGAPTICARRCGACGRSRFSPRA